MKKSLILLFVALMTMSCAKKIYSIQNAAASPEEAVLLFFKAIAAKNINEINKYHFNKKEYIKIFHPEFRDYPSITSPMEAQEAWEIIDPRRRMGLQKILNNLQGKNIRSIEIKYKNGSPKTVGNLEAYFPSVIYVNTDREKISIEEIGTIISSNRKFKIAILTTG